MDWKCGEATLSSIEWIGPTAAGTGLVYTHLVLAAMLSVIPSKPLLSLASAL